MIGGFFISLLDAEARMGCRAEQAEHFLAIQ
jgi:hypothetical protein